MGRTRAVAALLLFAVAGCVGASGSGSPGVPPLTSPPAGVSARNVIDHVVVIVQENRTFDNLFMGFNGADSTPGLLLTPTTFAIDAPYNAHDWFRCLQANDFDPSVWRDYANGVWPAGAVPCPTSSPPENPDTTFGKRPGVLSIVDALHRVTYWSIAGNYELGDNFWAIEASDSFAAHQYIVALQSVNDLNEIVDGTPKQGNDSSLSCGTVIPANDVNTPTLDLATGWTNWHYEGATGACWGAPTFGDHLDAAHVDWRHYSTDFITQLPGGPVGGTTGGVFNGFINYRQWYPQTKGAIPGGRFRKSIDDLAPDIAARAIGQFAWVKPPCIALSDHPGTTHDPYGGQDWVASIVNAIGRDQALWQHTVIFVVWDDWGGFYDHAIPAAGLLDPVHALTPGMRQPFLVISAYGKGRGYVSHAPGNYASVLKFAEDLYGIAPLNALDANATDLSDFFNFAKQPDPFTPVTISEPNFDVKTACGTYVGIPLSEIDR